MITTQRELSAEHARATASLTRSRLETDAVVERSVQKVARDVKAQAARRGDHVVIRVTRRAKSIRITIRGPRAADYRQAVQQAMKAHVPQLQSEIRAVLSRSS